MKKFIGTVLLALGIASFAVSPTKAYCEEEEIIGNCGDGTYWVYDFQQGLLHIGGSGYMDSMESGRPWDEFDVSRIYVDDSVQSIGNGAFANMPNISQVYIGNSVQSIGDSAFANMQNKYLCVYVPSSVTEIGDNAFDCEIICDQNSYAMKWAEENQHSYVLKTSFDYNPVAKGKCGNNLTWEYDLNQQRLTISGTGDMYDMDYGYVEYAAYSTRIYPDGFWFFGSGLTVERRLVPVTETRNDDQPWRYYYIRELCIEEGVTSIGAYAFYGLDIDNIEIKGSTLKKIGRYAFSHSMIREFKLPESLENIDDYAFSENYMLQNLKLNEGLLTIGWNAFMGTKYRDYLEIPESVVWMGNFIGVEKIGCVEDSYAHQWAIENNIKYVITKQSSKKVVKESDVTLSKDSYTYSGKACNPTVKAVVSGKTLKAGTDYTVSYANNINAGTATVTVTFKGNYKGTITKNFTIKAKKATTAEVTLSKTSVAYTGKAIKPTVKAVLGNEELIKNTDYTVKYANNTKVGTATVTVTFKGNYSGTVKKTFEITKATTKITTSASTYNKKTTSKAFNLGATSTGGKLTYSSDNKKVAKVSSAGKVTIVGKGTAVITIKAAETATNKAATKKIKVVVK